MNLGIAGKKLDIEWVKLIQEAKALGLTREEIQRYLTEFGLQENSDSR